MGKKNMSIANFNVTFGEKEAPLLEYFEDIVLPAFISDYRRSKNDTEYILMNVKVQKIDEDDFVLSGIIVKKTVLEIKSVLTDDVLIETDELHPTAPYSTFVIYLKNHRMVLVKNQKGSPDLRSFSATITYIFKNYIREENKKRKEENKNLLPYCIINIVGISTYKKIAEILGGVKKINKLILKFYPLNGDLDYGALFDGLTTDVRKKVGSKTGSAILNSPTNKNGVAKLLDGAQGTIEPMFKVEFEGGKKGTIKHMQLTETMLLQLDDKKPDEIADDVVQSTKDMESIKKTSDENKKIFLKYLETIKKHSNS